VGIPTGCSLIGAAAFSWFTGAVVAVCVVTFLKDLGVLFISKLLLTTVLFTELELLSTAD